MPTLVDWKPPYKAALLSLTVLFCGGVVPPGMAHTHGSAPSLLPTRCCSVVRLRDAPRPVGSTLHFKGFGRGLNYSHPAVKWAFQDVSQFVRRSEPTYLAFDGDPFRPDSFTAMLPELLKATLDADSPPQPRLLVFKYDTEENINEVEETWKMAVVPGGLRLLAVPEDPSGEDNPRVWAALGGVGLRFTGADTALCFGGGDTIAVEIRDNPEVTFHVWPVPRAGRDGRLQQCALSGLALDNVVVHDLPQHLSEPSVSHSAHE